MSDAPSTIRVVIPLNVKHRNGRPRIVPPDDVEAEPSAQEPHCCGLLPGRGVGSASWRAAT
jgi:hypothetical protein